MPRAPKTSPVSLALLAAALLALPATAQEEMKPASPTTPMSGDLRELLRRFDKNGDGRLDENEKAAARRAMREDDGGTEKERRKQLLKRFDKNGDGRLDDAERAEAEKARDTLARNGGADRFRALSLQRFDKNGDGRLDDTEQAEAAKFRAEMIKRFDADGDGQLNDTEREAALKAFMADRPAPPKKKKKD